MRNTINTTLASIAIALGLFSAHHGLETLKNYARQRIDQEVNAEFVAYAGEFERGYGPFEKEIELTFQSLPPRVAGRVINDHTIALNAKGLYDSSLTERRSTLKHELAHVVIDKIIREVNPRWINFQNGGVYVNRGMGEIYKTISEGGADYLTVQNGGRNTENYLTYYHFIKPILDGLGAQNGIRKLLLEPPTTAELKDPLSYYKRINFKGIKD